MEKSSAAAKINELLEGEISAVETYRQALDKAAPRPETEDIRRIQNEHLLAVDTLESHVRQLGGQPARDSGAWGKWTHTVTGAARLFGDDSALGALRAGEEYGKSMYQVAADSQDIPEGTRRVIREILLPKQQEHIATLNRIIGG